MTGEQVLAARRILNAYRASVKLDVVQTDTGESLTPYLIANHATRGSSVNVTTETQAAHVARELSASISGIV